MVARPRLRPGLPFALWASLVLLAAAELWIIAATADVPVPDQWGFRGYEAGMALAFGSVGALVASRQRRNRIGWLLLAMSLLVAVQGVVTQYPVLAVADPSVPFTGPVRWLRAWIWVVPNVGLLSVMLLLFPTGRLPGPRWRYALALAAIAAATQVTLLILATQPIGPVPPTTAVSAYFQAMGPVMALGPLLLSLSALAGGASIIVRYRGASADEREQIKWVAWAGTLAVPGIVVGLSPVPIGQVFFIAAAFFGAFAIAIAILRYRLYDIDLIINRTLLYLSLSAILAGVFSATITLTQKVFVAMSNQESDAALVLTTLVVVSLFTPLKTALQSIIDRRYKPAAAIATAGPSEMASTDPFVLIARLTELRTGGSITEAEFEAKKTELLGRI